MIRTGRYEVEGEIGRGSTGVVYLARDPRVLRQVAIKSFCLPDGLPDEQRERLHQRFLREAQTAGRLSHPGIVTIYDVDQDSERGMPFIAMEYVQGRSLREVLIEEGRIDAERAIAMIDTIAEALESAHDAGIVHRDIKPANILVRESDGALKIADFGIARHEISELTRTGTALGSPAYMSPEQFRGEEADARSDLFSLGVILYQMLTGTRPFPGDDLAAIAYSVVHREPRPVSELLEGASEEVDVFFERALAKNGDDRFPDVTTFRLALGGMATCLPVGGFRSPDQPPPAAPVIADRDTDEVVDAVSGMFSQAQLDTGPTEGFSPLQSLERVLDDESRRRTRITRIAVFAAVGFVATLALVLGLRGFGETPITEMGAASPGNVRAETMSTPPARSDATSAVAAAIGAPPTTPEAGPMVGDTPTTGASEIESVEGPIAVPAEQPASEAGSSFLQTTNDSPDETTTAKSEAASAPRGEIRKDPDARGPDSPGPAPAASLAASTNAPVKGQDEPADGLRPRQPALAGTRPPPVGTSIAREQATTTVARPEAGDGGLEGVRTEPAGVIELEPIVRPASRQEPVPVAVPPGRLAITVESGVRSGTLVVRIDGKEMLRRRLEAGGSPLKRWSRKAVGKAQQVSDETLALPPGQHRVEVEILADGRSRVDRESLELEVSSGETRHLYVQAGRNFVKRLRIRSD